MGTSTLLRSFSSARMPIDVEIRCIAARRPVFEHIPPILVVLARDGHVVRNDIQHLAQVAFAEPLAEAGVRLLAAQFRIDVVMIHHVVAVPAAGSRLQIWRAVNVTDAKIMQIICDRRGIVECEILMKLDAIGGERNSLHS